MGPGSSGGRMLCADRSEAKTRTIGSVTFWYYKKKTSDKKTEIILR